MSMIVVVLQILIWRYIAIWRPLSRYGGVLNPAELSPYPIQKVG